MRPKVPREGCPGGQWQEGAFRGLGACRTLRVEGFRFWKAGISLFRVSCGGFRFWKAGISLFRVSCDFPSLLAVCGASPARKQGI